MGVLFGWGLDGLAGPGTFARPPIPRDPRVQAPGLIAPLASSAPRPPPGPSHLSPPRCCQCPAACSRVDPARLGWGEGGWWAALLAWLFACLPLRGCPPAQLSPPPSPPVFPPAEIAHGRFTLPSNSLSLFNRSLKRKKESFSERPNCARSLFLRPVARFFVIDGPFSVSSPFSGSTHARAAHTHPPVINIPTCVARENRLSCLLAAVTPRGPSLLDPNPVRRCGRRLVVPDRIRIAAHRIASPLRRKTASQPCIVPDPRRLTQVHHHRRRSFVTTTARTHARQRRRTPSSRLSGTRLRQQHKKKAHSAVAFPAFLRRGQTIGNKQESDSGGD